MSAAWPDDGYTYAPTPAQMREHVSKGGEVQYQADSGYWFEDRSHVRRGWASDNEPRYGRRLKPLPEPQTITIEVPTAWAKYRAHGVFGLMEGSSEVVDQACAAALEAAGIAPTEGQGR